MSAPEEPKPHPSVTTTTKSRVSCARAHGEGDGVKGEAQIPERLDIIILRWRTFAQRPGPRHVLLAVRAVVANCLCQIKRNRTGEVTDVNQYHIVRVLGEGSTAVAYLCRHRRKDFAIKVFNKSMLSKKRTFLRGASGMVVETAMDKVKEEIAIMKKLEHDNLVGP